MQHILKRREKNRGVDLNSSGKTAHLMYPAEGSFFMASFDELGQVLS